MVVELISVGTELLLGNIVNTNSQYLSEQCAFLGCTVYFQTIVGDNESRMETVFKTAIDRSDVVIVTGGLGPTKDDITKEIVASILNKELVEDEKIVKKINSYFNGLNLGEIPKSNYKQALVIEGSKVLENNNGTAPGLLVTDNDKTIIMLPGPPREMIPLFNEYVKPYLKSRSKDIIYSVMVKMCGIGESAAAELIDDLITSQENPTIAPYAKPSEVHLRITTKAANEDIAKELTQPLLVEIEKRLGKYIYSMDEDESLEDVLVKLLKDNNLTISTAESCTGGLLSGRIINVPSVSTVFNEGFITYSNEAKEKTLKIDAEVLSKYGAVSKETAELMAKGCANLTSADIGLSTTGIAGPDGGSPEKPVGLVYIGCYFKGKTIVEKYQFKGSREKVREITVTKAIDLARKSLLEN